MRHLRGQERACGSIALHRKLCCPCAADRPPRILTSASTCCLAPGSANVSTPSSHERGDGTHYTRYFCNFCNGTAACTQRDEPRRRRSSGWMIARTSSSARSDGSRGGSSAHASS
eukprot:1481128-Rhodomonas_salina.1